MEQKEEDDMQIGDVKQLADSHVSDFLPVSAEVPLMV